LCGSATGTKNRLSRRLGTRLTRGIIDDKDFSYRMSRLIRVIDTPQRIRPQEIDDSHRNGRGFAIVLSTKSTQSRSLPYNNFGQVGRRQRKGIENKISGFLQKDIPITVPRYTNRLDGLPWNISSKPAQGENNLRGSHSSNHIIGITNK
jgi:hypothetical protein